MNNKIKMVEEIALSEHWFSLRNYIFDYQVNNQHWQRQQREVFDKGDGATVLLYNREAHKVVLTKQFRLPSYLNQNPDGMLIETCAGVLEGDAPIVCITKEILEETGFKIDNVTPLFNAYMSPGAVTELIHFFVASYNQTNKVAEGGGLAHEEEHIEVLEIDFEKAYGMIASGEIQDGKTIMLLQHAKLNIFT